MRRVNTVILFGLLFSATQASAIQKYINKYSERYHVNPRLVEAMIYVESSFRINVVGDDGCSHGLMQIQMSTARDEGFRGTRQQLIWPIYNIKYGVKYLRTLLAWTQGDVLQALDAYNRGIGNVLRRPYRGDWREHKYVGKIIKFLEANGNSRVLQIGK